MRNFLICFLMSALASISAFAANQCYSPDEVAAEELLRLHSELMVITVTCHHGSDGSDLVSAYTGFTKANIGVIQGAEHIMEKYYSAHYGGDGVSRLDTLRTRLGNEFGMKIAKISAPVYCGEYRDKVLTFYQANPETLQDEVHHMVVTDKTYVKACTPVSHVAKQEQ